MGMRRTDRRDNSYDNSVKYPHSRSSEPVSPHHAESLLATIRSQRDEAKQQAQKKAEEAERSYQLYSEEQQRYQSTLTLYQEEQEKAASYLTLYDQEKIQSGQWLAKYEEAQAESQKYLALYTEAETQLKFERRSKAGIKGWETRRKRENERLKQEIADMMVVLRDSMAREGEAVTALEEVAGRMDRIQSLVNSVDDETDDTPLGMLQKLKRIWQAIKDIMAE
ncbi:hypothetical protein PN498_23220 [Oscillatoria sp. CS-180]|uniref:hypothetical protein n=1 Tax=Oscillatoria sp. CS-180 TaxID=3021720 RepID=UPI00232B9DFE|nr:hypothetical protein [Oscillatoria sp. CS-180]MDB9528923.1 hypothetical protein [Oscillatoria sp. CS-180]